MTAAAASFPTGQLKQVHPIPPSSLPRCFCSHRSPFRLELNSNNTLNTHKNGLDLAYSNVIVHTQARPVNNRDKSQEVLLECDLYFIHSPLSAENCHGLKAFPPTLRRTGHVYTIKDAP